MDGAPVRPAVAGGALLLAVACWAPSGAPPAPSQPTVLSSPDGVSLVLERVATAHMPVAFVAVGQRLYVGELSSGRIVSDGREVADLAVSAGAESGLESLAVGAGGRTLFAYYSASSDPPADGGAAAAARVARFAVRRDGTLGRPETILEVPGAGVHNAGAVGVGPDGLVYVNLGDNIRRGAAQDLGSPFGKILRLRPDGRPAPGNPFPRRRGADPRVWALGIRNTFAFTWLAGGTMVGADNGERAGDEVNVLRAGANYGWPPETAPRGAVEPLLLWPDTFAPAGLAAVPAGWGPWSRGDKVLACGAVARRMDLIDLDRPAVAPQPVLDGCPFALAGTRDGAVLFATDDGVWRLAPSG
ncbi:MAG: PQQ-dependent sugar dehydrogenase [Euzebyales bacterium]|nr:PQQ-dependent sugar dehydrogenase [Euzebyales bacterium]MBA3620723.1 PQQ-dependent sugar dehydrogenase [Euzebyales bacterium]